MGDFKKWRAGSGYSKNTQIKSHIVITWEENMFCWKNVIAFP